MKLESYWVERQTNRRATRWVCQVCHWTVEVNDASLRSTIGDLEKYLQAVYITEDELALRTMARDLPPHYHLKERTDDLQLDHRRAASG